MPFTYPANPTKLVCFLPLTEEFEARTISRGIVYHLLTSIYFQNNASDLLNNASTRLSSALEHNLKNPSKQHQALFLKKRGELSGSTSKMFYQGKLSFPKNSCTNKDCVDWLKTVIGSNPA